MDGTIAKMHTYPSIAVTPEVGDATPSIELIGYYSGDDENGALFGQPAATAGKAITVVKYNNLDKATALYYSTAQVAPMKKNILSESTVNGFMTKENTSSVSLGTTEQENISLPETIARPEMVMPTIKANSVRPLKHFQMVRTK